MGKDRPAIGLTDDLTADEPAVGRGADETDPFVLNIPAALDLTPDFLGAHAEMQLCVFPKSGNS